MNTKLTKEQENQVCQKLSSIFGAVHLLCDGYKVTLAVEQVKPMTFRVMTYVNGEFRGAWILPKNEAPESRFLRESTRPFVSAKERRAAERAFGKRYVKSSELYSGKMKTFHPDWASGKAALAHLRKVCTSIQIIDNGEERKSTAYDVHHEIALEVARSMPAEALSPLEAVVGMGNRGSQST